ncbi:MAG: Fe-S cluster assembly protein SufD [Acidobacteria bacterium]|nr:MAG: Fe-S cluster assembly protein SufD [Acidobacteriota bacterium]
MTPSSTVAADTELYRADFEAFAAGRSGAEPSWLQRQREEAMERFQERGFPTTAEEDWRFTNVAPIARTAFRRATGAGLGPVRAEAPQGGPEIVFVDGRYSPAQSSAPDEGGVEVRSLAEALAKEPARLAEQLGRLVDGHGTSLADLNTAFLDDGAVIFVPAGLVVKEPLHVRFFSTATSERPMVTHPRTLVVAGRNSQAQIVEIYGGAAGAAYFTNAVTEIVLEDGAVVDHYRLQRESEAAYHAALTAVVQGRASRFKSHSFALGARLARHDLRQLFAAEGGECELLGLFAVAGEQHTDTHTLIDHAHPHCTSRELYKGILDGKARGVFVGRIVVREGASKTDAHQTNKNLLLSREALVDSLPQLEILASDVKCKHGSTTGQLDPTALFYLRSRGISEAAARSLLVSAFAGDVVGRVGVPALRAALERDLRERLPGLRDREIQEAVL